MACSGINLIQALLEEIEKEQEISEGKEPLTEVLCSVCNICHQMFKLNISYKQDEKCIICPSCYI